MRRVSRRQVVKYTGAIIVGGLVGGGLVKEFWPTTETVQLPGTETTITETEKLEPKVYELRGLAYPMAVGSEGLTLADCICRDESCEKFVQINEQHGLNRDAQTADEFTTRFSNVGSYIASIDSGIKKVEALQPIIESIEDRIEALSKGGSADSSMLQNGEYDRGGYGTLLFYGKFLAELFLNKGDLSGALDRLQASDGVVKYFTEALGPRMKRDLEGLQEQSIIYQRHERGPGRNLWDRLADGWWGYYRALTFGSTIVKPDGHCCLCVPEGVTVFPYGNEISDCAQLQNLISPDDESVKYFESKIEFPADIDVPEDLKRIVLGKAAYGINQITDGLDGEQKTAVKKSIAELVKRDPTMVGDIVYAFSWASRKFEKSDELKQTVVGDLKDLFRMRRYSDGWQLIRLVGPTLWPTHATALDVYERIHPARAVITPDLSEPDQLKIMREANQRISDTYIYSPNVDHSIESFTMAEEESKGGKPIGDGTFRAGALYYVASRAGIVYSDVVKFYPPGTDVPIYILRAVIDGKPYAFGGRQEKGVLLVNGMPFDEFLSGGKAIYHTGSELDRLPRLHLDLNLAGTKVVDKYNV